MAQALPHDSDFSDDDQSPLDKEFSNSANHLRTITSKLSSSQLLEIYGLYKQASEGDCNIPRPGWLNMQGRQKWDSWRALKDTPQDAAKRNYIDLVKKLDPDWSDAKKSATKEMWVSVSTLQNNSEPDLDINKLSLIEAARENCTERVKELLDKTPELKDERDADGLSAVHWAADRDATSALIAALKAGCDIDAQDMNGQTALHYAASCGHVETIKILLKAGAKFIADEDGNTPYDVAADDEVMKTMKSFGPCYL